MNKRKTGLNKKFTYALEGIYIAVREEQNMKIHITVALLVIAGGIYKGLASWQWSVLLLTIGLVLVCEMINTAVETAVDLSSPEVHPLAKRAKDIAAGAVLLSALIAAVIGLVIFLV